MANLMVNWMAPLMVQCKVHLMDYWMAHRKVQQMAL
jgi:hypothetical protein